MTAATDEHDRGHASREEVSRTAIRRSEGHQRSPCARSSKTAHEGCSKVRGASRLTSNFGRPTVRAEFQTVSPAQA